MLSSSTRRAGALILALAGCSGVRERAIDPDPGVQRTPPLETEPARGAATPGHRTDEPASSIPSSGDAGTSDRDRDGVPDPEDRCPGAPGDRADDPAERGCPVRPDADFDGVPDALDACPREPSTLGADSSGCPPGNDRDGDGVPDAVDACPAEPGGASPDVGQNGCPDAARRL